MNEPTEPVAWAFIDDGRIIYTDVKAVADIWRRNGREVSPICVTKYPAPRGRVVVTEAMVRAAHRVLLDGDTLIGVETVRGMVEAALALVDADAPPAPLITNADPISEQDALWQRVHRAAARVPSWVFKPTADPRSHNAPALAPRDSSPITTVDADAGEVDRGA